MDQIKGELNLLGLKVKDVITGFTGIVTTVGFDLYGCVQAVVKPSELSKEGKVQDGEWFDTKRLAIVSTKPVMARPGFIEVPGPENKSIPKFKP